MIRSPSKDLIFQRVWPILVALLLELLGVPAMAQAPPARPEKIPAQFFTITEPITSETVAQIRVATKQIVDSAASAPEGQRPILVFVFHAGNKAPGTSEYGGCHDLANLISRELTGAKLTVAYLPEPLKGYAVLPAVACTEIVMSSSASLGPITPEGQAFDAADEGYVRFLAIRKTRDPDLLVGMLDRDADLRLIQTADKAVHYVLASNLAAFKKTHQEVIADHPAWEDGLRGVLSAKRAREEGFCTRNAESPAELASIYHIAGESTVEDPTSGQKKIPVWIPLEGPLDNVMVSYVTRRVQQAREEKANLLILQINSPGGNDTVTDRLADFVAAIKDMKTVAYIEDRAEGLAAMLPLACRDIVFKKGSRMGNVRQVIAGRNGPIHDLSEGQIAGLAGKAEVWARSRGHSEAVARAMVDPECEVLEALDSNTGASRLILRTDLTADPGRFQVLHTRKERGAVLTVQSDDAASYGQLGRVVNDAEELKNLYGLQGRDILMEGPGWIDSFVEFLTEPIVSWLLLFLGVFMMVVELKMPGVGLPGIISALAFLLFFWSHYLSGTADQLEIILFLIGLVCLSIELFVFPGLAIFGLSGVLLMLCSIVLASHTFIWPTQDYEYRELGYTLMQVTGMLFAVGIGAAILARYIPSLPLFNRLILKPEPWRPVESEETVPPPVMEGYESLNFLVGETGRSTTTLRPTGKARFGNLHIDVIASNGFVEPDVLVEVVDVQGARVVVKKV